MSAAKQITFQPAEKCFLSQRFSLLVRNEAGQFRNQQSRTTVKLATMVLFGTRGPSLFQVIREGLGSTVRLHDRGALRLANRLRLALEPECLENRRPPPE